MTATTLAESALSLDSTPDARPLDETRALDALNIIVPRTAVSTGYGVAMGLLAAWLTLIPIVYLGLLVFLGYLVVWHAYELFATFSDGPYFMFHLPMTILGALLLLFLIKPVFFRSRSKQDGVLTLSETDEPLLFAYVRKLCAVTGSNPPTRIEVDCDANAHARLRKGIASMFTGDLVLRIGLPLAGDLSLRQFTGVLAHELGHFNQRHGMSGSYLIRRLTFFFAKIVFQREKLDEILFRYRHSHQAFKELLYWLALIPIESARGVLWLMMVIGEVLTCGVLRRMEYDADRMEALVAGTGDFISTSRTLAFLQIAANVSRADLAEAWEDRRLADSLPGLTLANRRYLAESRGDLLKGLERRKTQWLDTHPSHDDRIRQVEALGAAGLMRCDASADQLFADFPALCRRATQAYYQSKFGEQVKEARFVPVDAFATERLAQRQAFRALHRFLRGHVVAMAPVFPAPDTGRPIDAAAMARQPNVAESAIVLRRTRDAMLQAADAVGKSSALFGKNVGAIAAARAQLALCDVFTGSPKAARLRERAASTLRRTEPLHAGNRKQYQAFAGAAQLRLSAALQILQTDTVALSRAGGGEEYVASCRSRVTQLVAVCRAMETRVTPINRLAELAVAIRVLAPSHNPARPHPPLVRQILGVTNEATDILRQLWRDLSPIAYPFAHATQGISVGMFIVPVMPDASDPAAVHSCAGKTLNTFTMLVFRVLAELTQWAEKIEEAVGLEPPPELPEKSDPQIAADDEKNRGAWRYWVGYGVRALSGIGMFGSLVWFSINPPVLPAMPWESGAPLGGYQPNSFRVPFTPVKLPPGYQSPGGLGRPGGFGPSRPGQFGPMTPQRPGMPRPPGYRGGSQRPWYQSAPSNGGGRSPGPGGGWGGGNHGGGGGGGGGHSGGGGHR